MTSVRMAKVKLGIALAFDVADFLIGRIPGWGSLFDVILVAVGVALYGWRGFAQLWELIDITDQVDGFVPTLTLIGLGELAAARKRENVKTELVSAG
jgi:hypothetical protein